MYSGTSWTIKYFIVCFSIEAKNIKVIYIQSEFDNENARVFAEEIKGKVLEVKPLSTEWEENLLEMTNLFIKNF